MTAVAENPMPKTVVASAGQGPDGIAVDLAAGYIYWTGMGVPADDDGFIRRSNLDGSNVVTLVPAGGTYTPKQMRARARERQALLVGPRGHARHAIEPRRLERRGAGHHGHDGCRPDGQLPLVRRDGARPRGRLRLLDPEGPGQRRRRLDPARAHPDAGRPDLRRTAPTSRSCSAGCRSRSTSISISKTDSSTGPIAATTPINRAPIEIPAGSTAANRKDRQILVTKVSEAIGVSIDKRRGRLYYTAGNGQLGRANLDGTQQDGADQRGGDDRHRRRGPAVSRRAAARARFDELGGRRRGILDTIGWPKGHARRPILENRAHLRLFEGLPLSGGAAILDNSSILVDEALAGVVR